MKIEISIEGFRVEGNFWVFAGRQQFSKGHSATVSVYSIYADSVQMVSMKGSFLTVYLNNYQLCGFVSTDVDLSELNSVWSFLG